MQCQKCGLEAMIMRTRMEASGDQSADTQTEVWAVQIHQCRNPQCSEYLRDVGQTRHRVYPEENDGEKGGERDGEI